VRRRGTAGQLGTLGFGVGTGGRGTDSRRRTSRTNSFPSPTWTRRRCEVGDGQRWKRRDGWEGRKWRDGGDVDDRSVVELRGGEGRRRRRVGEGEESAGRLGSEIGKDREGGVGEGRHGGRGGLGIWRVKIKRLRLGCDCGWLSRWWKADCGVDGGWWTMSNAAMNTIRRCRGVDVQW
jgi:hypothetical protein